jgi:hypothetical protein
LENAPDADFLNESPARPEASRAESGNQPVSVSCRTFTIEDE